ncbi:MAG: hypothetical protein JXB10_08600 [Pirellulales bacterium]|nr:hypothetical protein [Pirellulales bacterium]
MLNKSKAGWFIVALSLCGMAGHYSTSDAAAEEKPLYSQEETADFCKRFQIAPIEFHFPKQSFLEAGYAPPGGYVKDFGVIKHDGRYHLFHIDGRPTERCCESGNEISFGHASTADLRHWIRHRMPLAVGDRPWENEHVWTPFVTEWQGRYYMFYMAGGRHTPGVLTYAVSDDLETWTKWPGGAIQTAGGRDPFVRIADGVIYLYFTANAGGIEVVTSRDMQKWSQAKTVYRNPQRLPAESSSVHRRNGRWVLWFNDYIHCADPSGDFRPGYVFSDDPLKFDPQQLRVFKFTTPLPTKYGPHDWLEKRPIPVSIELLEKGENTWLVTYFRWHLDRFRLLIGALHWDTDPASIEEIVTPQRLKEVRAKMQ